jgi:hypothetical protein
MTVTVPVTVRVHDCQRRLWTRPSRLEEIAREFGAPPDELRFFLQELIQARLRARGEAWEKVDRVLDKRALNHRLLSRLAPVPRPHRDHTSSAVSDRYGAYEWLC